jgi:hypothetical protein
MHAIRRGLKDAGAALVTADFDVAQTDDVDESGKVVNQTDKVRQPTLISCIRILNSAKDFFRL